MHIFIFPVLRDDTVLQVENSLRLSSLLPLKLCILISLHHWRSTAASEEGEVSVTEIYIYIKKEQGFKRTKSSQGVKAPEIRVTEEWLPQ